MSILEEYLGWRRRKFSLSKLERTFQVNEGEVYWGGLGLNVGDEENGKGTNFRRPIMDVKRLDEKIGYIRRNDLQKVRSEIQKLF